MDWTSLRTWQVVWAVVCVVPGVILGVGVLLLVWQARRVLRALPRLTAPDTTELQKRYAALQAAHPRESQPQLVRRIINRHALRQGIVGALTSVGGLPALPLGLVVDLAYTARSNAALSYFIAQTYGIQGTANTLNVVQLLALRGRRVSLDEVIMWQEQLVGTASQQLLRTVLRKSVAKIVPVAGAVVGFAVNYASVQFFGTLANQYYAGHLGALLKRNQMLQAQVPEV